jgi:hypothetical protein
VAFFDIVPQLSRLTPASQLIFASLLNTINTDSPSATESKMNNSTAPPRLIDVESPPAVVSTPPASQLNSTLLVIINTNSSSATGSRMNKSTAPPRLIDVDSPPASDSTPRARPKPPSYVPRSTFDMTELLPVLDKITM